MKNQFFFLILSILSLTSFGQSHVWLKGQIGKYPIEMELWKADDAKKSIVGKYNYKGKTNYLNIEGKSYGEGILQLDEYFKKELTGSFYLQMNENDSLKGRWIAGKKYFNAYLTVSKGKFEDLLYHTNEELSKQTNNYIGGSYVEEIHFINDMWFTDKNPQIEIGYNVGYLTIIEKHIDTLNFSLQKVCGPTYHTATASGEAYRINDSTFQYKQKSEYSDEYCMFQLIKKGKEIRIEQSSSSSACGFGARAYADGTFLKIKNKTPQMNEEFIEGVYELED